MREKSVVAWPLRTSRCDAWCIMDAEGNILCQRHHSDDASQCAIAELVSAANAGHEASREIVGLRNEVEKLEERAEKAERHLADSRATIAGMKATITARNAQIATLREQLATATARAEFAEAVSESDPRLSEIDAAMMAMNGDIHISIWKRGNVEVVDEDGNLMFACVASELMPKLREPADPLRADRARIAALTKEDREAVERVVEAARKEGLK